MLSDFPAWWDSGQQKVLLNQRILAEHYKWTPQVLDDLEDDEVADWADFAKEVQQAKIDAMNKKP